MKKETRQRLYEAFQAIVIEFREDFLRNREKYEKFLMFVHFLHVDLLDPTKKFRGSPTNIVAPPLEFSAVSQLLSFHISEFSSSRSIYKLIRENSLTPFENEKFEENVLYFPSIATNFIAGFIARNIELNHNLLIIDKLSFDQSFEELITFLQNDSYNVTEITSIYGIIGDIDEIRIDVNTRLCRPSNEIKMLFRQYYPIRDMAYEEFIEKGYVLEVSRQVFKKDRELEKIDQELEKRKRWRYVLSLTRTGNMEWGKTIRLTKAWPMETIRTPDATTNAFNKYHFTQHCDYYLDNNAIAQLKYLVALMESIKIEELNKKIIYSLDRLVKAKKARDINDRVVELSLALEYLTKSKASEIALQLSLKTIKLLFEKNEDPSIYKRIKIFYKLRNTVIHGNGKIDPKEENMELISFAEDIIQKALSKLIDLSRWYTFDAISDALDLSMHLAKPLSEILKETASAPKIMK